MARGQQIEIIDTYKIVTATIVAITGGVLTARTRIGEVFTSVDSGLNWKCVRVEFRN